jgi:hypothetical protein
VGDQHHAPAALPPGKRPGSHCIGGWVGPRVGLDGVENLTLTGIRFADRPARNESLHQLRYPGPLLCRVLLYFLCSPSGQGET